jgi:thioredoxin reductase
MTTRGFDPKALAGKVPEPERRVEVLVIGAGPAGVAAATEAARGGATVLLVDENPVSAGLMGLDTPLYYGGRYTGAVQTKARMLQQVFEATPRLEDAIEAGAEVELGAYCWGAWVPGHALAALPGPVAGLADEHRAWMVGFERLIIATGARDVALSFEGWDRPGVMGARALHSLVDTYDAFAGRRLAILGSDELALHTALFALRKGLRVAALIETGPVVRTPADRLAELKRSGVEILAGYAPIATRGKLDGVEALTVRPLAGGSDIVIACDTVVQAVSLTPVVELLDVLGAALAMRPTLGGHAPVSADGTATSLAEVFIAGDVAGVPGGRGLSIDEAEASGVRAAQAALASLGREVDIGPAQPPESDIDAVAYQQAWMRALMAANDASVVICQCEEVSREALLAVRQPGYLGPPSEGMARRDIGDLLEMGPANQDQIKRLTRACMGPCQARRCREQVALAMACASNQGAAQIPLAGYRAPVRPLPLQVLAAWEEDPVMSRNWDVWFGIKGQWIPYADIGTEREALYEDLMGGDMHL